MTNPVVEHTVDHAENFAVEHAETATGILGGYSGYFKDPDGYLWEVAHNPHFWVGPEDENA